MWAFHFHTAGKTGGTMELNELEQQRLDKLNRLREAGIEAYPRRSFRTHTIEQALNTGGG